MSHDVFICHSSKDRTLANAICAKLEANRIRCWIAPRDVVPGMEYAQSIVEAIGATHLTVLVFSENANQSPHVHRELERTASHGIPILPFRVEDVVPAPSVEYFISDAHWLDALTPPMEKHLDYLVGTVRLILDRQAATTGHPSAPLGSATVPEPSEPPEPPPAASPRRTRRYAVLAALALVVVAALVVGVVALRGGTTAAEDAPSGAGSTTSVPADGQADGSATSFVDEFDGALAEGWTWENEDPQAWAVSDGSLRIDLQTSPPVRNVLLREMPSGDFTVTTQIDFDPQTSDQPPTGGPSRFAGLVLTGDDLDTRLEVCWSSDGLSMLSWANGSILDGAQISADQFTTDEWIGAELTIRVRSGFYTAEFSSEANPAWEVDTGELDSTFDRVGLIASTTEEAGGESAAFARFVLE